MPIRKFVDVAICAFSRVWPREGELKGDVVRAGGGVPSGSLAAHIPTTGCALLSLATPASSSAVTAMDNVRLACAVNEK